MMKETNPPSGIPMARIDIAVARSLSLNHMLVTMIIELRKMELTLASRIVPRTTGQNSPVEMVRKRNMAPVNETS